MKFDIAVLKDFLQTFDLTRNLEVRAIIDKDTADGLITVLKQQMNAYLDEVYAKEEKAAAAPAKKAAKSGTQ
jgi:hypothetical protein